MVLSGSFHSAGYAGELDIRTGEMRKSMALREDVFSAMLLFLSRIFNDTRTCKPGGGGSGSIGARADGSFGVVS